MVGTVLARPVSQVELVPWSVPAVFNAVGRPLFRVVEGGFGVKPLLKSLGYSAETANHVLAGTLARTLAQVRNPFLCWVSLGLSTRPAGLPHPWGTTSCREAAQ